MMAALANAKASALRWCKASPGWARPTSATPTVMATVPSQAAVLGDSPMNVPLDSATSSGANPRMMG